MPTSSIPADEALAALVPPQPKNTAKWLICLLIACSGAWVGFAYPPLSFVIPVDLQAVDPNSSNEMKEKRAAADAVAYWKNVMFQFIWAGFFMGSVGLTAAVLNGFKSFGLGLMSCAVGLVSGSLAGASGALLRRFLDRGTSLASLGEDLRPMVADVIVLSVVSAIMLLPIGFYLLMSNQNDAKQKLVSTVLAGLVAGMMTPILVSIVTVFSLMPSEYNTELFPLVGVPVISLWLGLLLVMGSIGSTMIASRTSKIS